MKVIILVPWLKCLWQDSAQQDICMLNCHLCDLFNHLDRCSSFPQGIGDISKCATEENSNQSCILAVDTIIGGIRAARIVLEKKVLLWVTKLTDVVSFLFLCFFCLFLICHVSGTNSFYQFLEHVLMLHCTYVTIFLKYFSACISLRRFMHAW